MLKPTHMQRRHMSYVICHAPAALCTEIHRGQGRGPTENAGYWKPPYGRDQEILLQGWRIGSLLKNKTTPKNIQTTMGDHTKASRRPSLLCGFVCPGNCRTAAGERLCRSRSARSGGSRTARSDPPTAGSCSRLDPRSLVPPVGGASSLSGLLHIGRLQP